MSKQLCPSIGAALIAIAAALPGFPAAAAQEQSPIISMHTMAYSQAGGTKVSFRLMASQETTVTVDNGIESKTYNVTAGADASQASFIEVPIGEDCDIKVYGDAELIDFVDMEGLYLSSFDATPLSNLSVLMLAHNMLPAIDMAPFDKLQYVDLKDNVIESLVLDKKLPELIYLDLSYSAKKIDDSFTLSNYPALKMFVAQNTPLYAVDPTQCPDLIQLSIDGTYVSSLDLSRNPELLVLNISETRITDIDISKTPLLRQFYANHTGDLNSSYKIHNLDLSNNPELEVVFCTGNELESIDISNNPNLVDLYISNNRLTNIDITQNPNIWNLSIRRNNFTFATMPIVPEGTNLEWFKMNPMMVDPAYPEGAAIDLSDKVLREGGETYAQAFMTNPLEPSDPIKLEIGTDFDYADGVVTMKRAMADSCYVEFFNTLFDGGALSTSNFKVKTQEEFGKPTCVVSMTTLADAGTSLEYNIYAGVKGASYDNPVEIYVDFGNGELVPFQVTSSTAINGKVAGPGMGIYMPDGHFLSSLEINGLPLAGINLSKANELESVNIQGCGLEDIDLSWNNELRSINLADNKLRRLDLTGVNKAFVKNVLTQVNASNNEIESFVIENRDVIADINLSDNKLPAIDITDSKLLYSLNVAGNSLSEINLTGCASLQNIDVARNLLRNLNIPAEALPNITSLRMEENAFDFSTLPERTASMYSYQYAPQAKIIIPEKTFMVDLSNQCVDVTTSYTSYDENWQPVVVTETNPTIVAWYDSDNQPLAEGTDFTMENGITTFSDSMRGKSVYAVLSNASLPDFSGDNALTTTIATISTMPGNTVASFTTTKGGQTVDLRMASLEPDTYVYVDWSGDGSNMQECLLGTTYTVFEATTTEGANVRVLTYDESDPITVFSMTGASVKDVDVKRMKNAVMIAISQGELEEITLPESTNLHEIVFEDNNLSSIDLSKTPNLYSVVLDNNAFKTIDFSANKDIEWLSVSDNNLESLDVSMLGNLYQLHAHRNNLTSVDLSANPHLGTIGFENNLLTELDLSNNQELLEVIIGRNRMNFATLPLPRNEWGSLYSYSDQEPMSVECVNGKVDLSSQAAVDGIPTNYYWFLGIPELDPDMGTLTGVLLEENVDYIVENGVTTFLRQPSEDVTCVMQNEVFMYLALFTDPISVTLTGVDGVENDSPRISLHGNTITVTNASVAEICDINGISIAVAHNGMTHEARDLNPGIYMVKADGKTAKLIVK